MLRIASCCGVLLVLLALPAPAQRPTDSATVQDSALRVFFHCPGFADGCDFDFLRTEIRWVNWVRDREAADVHALVSTQSTGGGGTEYTLSLIGMSYFTFINLQYPARFHAQQHRQSAVPVRWRRFFHVLSGPRGGAVLPLEPDRSASLHPLSSQP